MLHFLPIYSVSSHSDQSGSDTGSLYLEDGRLILPDLLSPSAGGMWGVRVLQEFMG